MYSYKNCLKNRSCINWFTSLYKNLFKLLDISRRKGPTNTRKLNWNVSTIIALFLNQKRVNVCEHKVKTSPRGAVFIMCSHTFTLFWARKTSVIIESVKLPCVRVCFSFGDLFIFLFKSFLFLFLYFCVICTSVLSFPCDLF